MEDLSYGKSSKDYNPSSFSTPQKRNLSKTANNYTANMVDESFNSMQDISEDEIDLIESPFEPQSVSNNWERKGHETPNSLSLIATNLFAPGNGTLMMVFVFVALKVIVIGAIELFPIYLYFSHPKFRLLMTTDEVGIIYLSASIVTVIYQIICSKIIDMKGQLFSQHIAFQTALCMGVSLFSIIVFVNFDIIISHEYGRIGLSIICASVWFSSYSWVQLVSQFVSKLKTEYRNGIIILFLAAELLGGALNTILISCSFNHDKGSTDAPPDKNGYELFIPYYAFILGLCPIAFLSWDMIRGRIGIVRRI